MGVGVTPFDAFTNMTDGPWYIDMGALATALVAFTVAEEVSIRGAFMPRGNPYAAERLAEVVGE